MDGDRLTEGRETPPPPPRETPRALSSATGQRHTSARHRKRAMALFVLFIGITPLYRRLGYDKCPGQTG
jgi:hypothetical protein